MEDSGAWINNARAHGEFDKYHSNSVKRMMEGIVDFLDGMGMRAH
jgi:hypothetical protein